MSGTKEAETVSGTAMASGSVTMTPPEQQLEDALLEIGRKEDVIQHLQTRAETAARESMQRFDEMNALLQGYKADAARLREVLGKHCSGVIHKPCSMCHDSTWDHECDSREEPCPHCAALASGPSERQAKCPGPDCKACNGEACDKCGKGSWSPSAPECTHDALQRHEAPSAEPTLPLPTGPRPDSERLAWIMSGMPAVGRTSVDLHVFNELRAEVDALRAVAKSVVKP